MRTRQAPEKVEAAFLVRVFRDVLQAGSFSGHP